MQNELNKRVGSAAKWSGITEVAAKLIAPVTNMVLARLLTPEAFGVVATLTMVVSFAEIFTDAGFQKYLVQHQFRDEKDLDEGTNVAFWTNLTFSMLIWLVIACFATPIVRLVGSEGYEPAVIVMCAQIPLLAFSSIQMARFRRDFDFKSLFVVRMATSAVPLVVTVPLALIFRSYWALVAGTLARDLLNAVILTSKSKWKPKFGYSVARLKEMLSFSMWTIIENVSIWLTSYAGIFVISAYYTDHYLGLYKTTMSTVNSFMTIITAATTPVLFSALSRCQEDNEAYQDVFFRFQRMVAMLVFPLGFGICAYRQLATSILLGSQWMETAGFLGLWSLTSALSIIFNNYNSEVFRSKGRPKLSVLVQALHLAVMIPVLIWAAPQGYETLTLARCLVRFQLIAVSLIVLRAAIGIRFGRIVRNVWPSLLSAAVMACAGWLFCGLSDNVIWQFASIGLCAVLYALCMLAIPAGRKQLEEIPLVRRMLAKLTGRKTQK